MDPSANPFLSAATCSSVFVAHGGGPYANCRRALESVDLSPVRGKRVLLKPNVGRVAALGSGVVTHPEVIAAAIDIFRQAGAEVAVGESPIVGVKVHEAFAAAGVTEIAEKRNCPLIDMDRRPCVELPVPEGRVIRSLKLCPEVMEFDFIISIPVMKRHMHTGATLAVKNMKGCLWRRSKVELHMLPALPGSKDKSLDIAIADMASVLRPHLSIIDGTVGMEGLGPSAGRPKPLDAVVVGADAFAADAVACQLMGTTAGDIPHLRLGAERGYGVIDLDRLTVAPENWRDAASPFAAPPANLTIEFPNITVYDQNSCSSCQSTLLLFLARYKDQIFDYFPSESKIHIAIGKNTDVDLPEGTLLVGNCTACHRGKGIFVPGCPPVGSQILAAIDAASRRAGEYATVDAASRRVGGYAIVDAASRRVGGHAIVDAASRRVGEVEESEKGDETSEENTNNAAEHRTYEEREFGYFRSEEKVAGLVGNLPHWRQEGVTYYVTFRLADSLPQEKVEIWLQERDAWVALHPKPWNDATRNLYHKQVTSKIEKWLDAGYGSCILARKEVRDVVENAMRHFDGSRYWLDAWVIMPNHVHAILTPLADNELSKILHSWKSFTSHRIKNILPEWRGALWQKESFDHIVRDSEHLEHFRHYIAANPKGLPEDSYSRSGVSPL